jgi:hypothetical protein
LPNEHPELSAKAAAKLLEALAPKGAAAGTEPATVQLGVGDLVARCVVFDRQERDGLTAVAVGIEVIGPGLDQPVRDAVAARAPTEDEAISHAVQTWLAGLFIPLRDALGDQAVPYQFSMSQRDNSTGEQTDWCVYQSPLQIGGEEEVHQKLFEALKDPPLFRRFVQSAALPPLKDGQLHWLKVDVVGQDARTLNVDAAFDGAPWKECRPLFEKFAWPGKGLQMFRQYWVVVAN